MKEVRICLHFRSRQVTIRPNFDGHKIIARGCFPFMRISITRLIVAKLVARRESDPSRLFYVCCCWVRAHVKTGHTRIVLMSLIESQESPLAWRLERPIAGHN